MIEEIPVFDRSTMLPILVDTPDEWQPARSRIKARGVALKLSSDGPDVEWRLDGQAARITSNKFSGQAANDNEDWPLQKLLRTESNDHCLALAERYRAIHDLATMPVEIAGKEPNTLYVLQDQDVEGRSKGTKTVSGRKATIETFPRRGGSPIPQKWNGDWRLLSAIDAKRELAMLRGRLAYVPTILDGFEWAVVDGLTLAEIGVRLGAGSKGAKGEARARIFDGFGIVDRFWRQGSVMRMIVANDNAASASWKPGEPTPAGYYRSKLHPGMIFPKYLAA